LPIDPLGGGLHGARREPEMVLPSDDGSFDEPATLQHLEVARYCRLGNRHTGGDLAGREYASRELLDDVPPHRIGKRAEHVIQGRRTFNHVVIY